MFGEIGAWLYKALGGIRPDSNAAGFSHFFLEPHFVAGLNAFEAAFRSPNGSITSSWKKSGDRIDYRVTVPPNSTATLSLQMGKKKLYENGRLITALSPDKSPASRKAGHSSYLLESGTYQFVVK